MSNAMQVNCRKFIARELKPMYDENAAFLCCIGERRSRTTQVDNLFIHRIVAGARYRARIDVRNLNLSRKDRSTAVCMRMKQADWCKVDVTFAETAASEAVHRDHFYVAEDSGDE